MNTCLNVQYVTDVDVKLSRFNVNTVFVISAGKSGPIKKQTFMENVGQHALVVAHHSCHGTCKNAFNMESSVQPLPSYF